jgi:hypothetical protein
MSVLICVLFMSLICLDSVFALHGSRRAAMRTWGSRNSRLRCSSKCPQESALSKVETVLLEIEAALSKCSKFKAAKASYSRLLLSRSHCSRRTSLGWRSGSLCKGVTKKPQVHLLPRTASVTCCGVASAKWPYGLPPTPSVRCSRSTTERAWNRTLFGCTLDVPKPERSGSVKKSRLFS